MPKLSDSATNPFWTADEHENYRVHLAKLLLDYQSLLPLQDCLLKNSLLQIIARNEGQFSPEMIGQALPNGGEISSALLRIRLMIAAPHHSELYYTLDTALHTEEEHENIHIRSFCAEKKRLSTAAGLDAEKIPLCVYIADFLAHYLIQANKERLSHSFQLETLSAVKKEKVIQDLGVLVSIGSAIAFNFLAQAVIDTLGDTQAQSIELMDDFLSWNEQLKTKEHFGPYAQCLKLYALAMYLVAAAHACRENLMRLNQEHFETMWCDLEHSYHEVQEDWSSVLVAEAFIRKNYENFCRETYPQAQIAYNFVALQNHKAPLLMSY
jgi:hypothetical protein